jgi:hypothetical protein
LPGVGLVKAAQKAVPNQRADNLAMRTRRLLEPPSHRGPFLVVADKTSLLTHAGQASTKIMILPARGRGGVVAGYEKNSLSGVRGKIPGRLAQPRQSLCQILGVTKFLQSDDNSAIFAANCDQSEVKDTLLTMDLERVVNLLLLGQ